MIYVHIPTSLRRSVFKRGERSGSATARSALSDERTAMFLLIEP